MKFYAQLFVNIFYSGLGGHRKFNFFVFWKRSDKGIHKCPINRIIVLFRIGRIACPVVRCERVRPQPAVTVIFRAYWFSDIAIPADDRLLLLLLKRVVDTTVCPKSGEQKKKKKKKGASIDSRERCVCDGQGEREMRACRVRTRKRVALVPVVPRVTAP